MATNKSVRTTKKSGTRSTPVAKKTTTNVTTVRAASSTRGNSQRFSFSRSPLLAASVAEFIGIFMLAAIFLITQGTSLYLLFALMAVVLSVGVVSGAHVNPAITVGAWATRRITSVRAVSYIVAQVLGALLALVVVNAFISAAPAVSDQAAQLGQQAPQLFKLAAMPNGHEWLILASELIGTVIFAFGFAAVNKDRNRTVFALGAGGALFLGLTIGQSFAVAVGGTAAVLNPAVAGAVQAVSWSWMPILAYVVAPLVGGVIGFALQDLVRNESVVAEV